MSHHSTAHIQDDESSHFLSTADTPTSRKVQVTTAVSWPFTLLQTMVDIGVDGEEDTVAITVPLWAEDHQLSLGYRRRSATYENEKVVGPPNTLKMNVDDPAHNTFLIASLQERPQI